MRDLILASSSEWRKRLLEWLEIPFAVVESGFDETSIIESEPQELVTALAMAKAMRVGKDLKDGLIIGADTVIALPQVDGEFVVIGKPHDRKDAERTLRALKGKSHFVYTGVAIWDVMTNERLIEFEETEVVFKNFSDQVLNKFLDSGIWMGKAGSYQILSVMDAVMVDSVRGSVTGVIGLPLRRIAGMLEELGVIVPVEVEEVVMEKIGYRD